MLLHIEIISDVVCPWCFIGERKLASALKERPGLEVKVGFRPYLLHPYLPPEGMDRDALMLQKFGRTSKSLFRRVEQVGRDVGIEFAFDRVARVPDTTAAHSVIDWAESGAGRGAELVERLFEAYFLEGRDVGRFDVLAELGATCGLDQDETRERLERGDDRARIRQLADENRERGVTGVPFFLVGTKYFVPGAQEPETILRVVDRAVERGLFGPPE